jgi:hypothetical protein
MFFGILKPGGLFTFNTNDGYLEALVRGYRSGILSTADYANLIQCDALEGIVGCCGCFALFCFVWFGLVWFVGWLVD